jgi:hypothetical protein
MPWNLTSLRAVVETPQQHDLKALEVVTNHPWLPQASVIANSHQRLKNLAVGMGRQLHVRQPGVKSRHRGAAAAAGKPALLFVCMLAVRLVVGFSICSDASGFIGKHR